MPHTRPTEPWQLLERQLCFALYSSSLAMTKVYKPLLEPLGLTYPQFLVMLVLWESDGVSLATLGERVALDSGTLTPLLKRLEAAGLVQRLRERDDERRMRLVLTPRGRALQSRAADVPRRLVEATGCTLREIESLTKQLNALRSRLQEARHRAAA